MVFERLKHLPDTALTRQYSPESFTGTELDYALDVCETVLDCWEASKQNKVIINLPATVEMSTPNIYADQIEWFCNKIKRRDSLLISLHTHNDRGCAVAAGELGIMAGADRVEGTLMGCKSAILHLYNSVSTLQRKVVFKQDKKGVKKIA